jgi:UDP-glucose 4-epimerase
VRVLVTGGAGFIGSNLVDALVARGDDVVVLDDLSSGKRSNVNPAARFVEGSILTDALGEAIQDAEVCFHLAAQADVPTSVARPEFDAQVNVVGTVRVLAAAGDAPVVFSSTGGAIYGECERPPGGRPAAARSAPTASQALRRGVPGRLEPDARDAGTPPFASRTSTGPARRPGSKAGVVAIFLTRWRRLGDRIYGDGQQTRDFVHVDDVVRALLRRQSPRRRVQRLAAASRRRFPPLEDCTSSAARSPVPAEPSFAPAREGDVLHRRPGRVAHRARASGGGRRSRSTTGSAGPGTGSSRGRRAGRAGRSHASAVDHPLAPTRARPALAHRHARRRRIAASSSSC